MKDSDSTIGKKLTDMFYENWKDKASIEKLKKSFSIEASELNILVSLFWLFYLAFSRAAQSCQDKISRSQYESISNQLATNVGKKCSSIFGAEDIYRRLYICYGENLDSEPSVHYYVGKEMCIILNGDEVPNPAMILWFAEIFHKDTVRIKQYIDSI